MTINTISVSDISLVQIRLVEVFGTGAITVNDRHFVLKQGQIINITQSLYEGINIITFIVNTNSIKEDPSRLLIGKYEWLGRFEIYIDNILSGSYFKKGTYIIGGKENIIESIEIEVVKDVSKPKVIELINQLQIVEGITDANKTDFPKSHPHLIFKNGVTIYTWKNYAGVNHVFITDRSGKCVYGGYVGWIHSKQLQSCLQKLRNDLENYII